MLNLKKKLVQENLTFIILLTVEKGAKLKSKTIYQRLNNKGADFYPPSETSFVHAGIFFAAFK